MRKTAGRCLCGQVKFEISGEFDAFFLCHCSRCRKDTGSVHAANLFSSSATIDWISGQSDVRTYRLPATLHERSFCGKCGSALPGMQMEGRLLVVPAGSLDGEIGLAPTSHICLADRAGWEDALATAPRLQGLPGRE